MTATIPTPRTTTPPTPSAPAMKALVYRKSVNGPATP